DGFGFGEAEDRRRALVPRLDDAVSICVDDRLGDAGENVRVGDLSVCLVCCIHHPSEPSRSRSGQGWSVSQTTPLVVGGWCQLAFVGGDTVEDAAADAVTRGVGTPVRPAGRTRRG